MEIEEEDRIKAFVEKYEKLEEGLPTWFPLAEEILDKIKALGKILYKEVPWEIRKYHRAEALSQGINWELTARAHDGNTAAWRMDWLTGARAGIETLLVSAEDERRKQLGIKPDLKLAKRRDLDYSRDTVAPWKLPK